MYENTCFDRFKILPDFERSIPLNVMEFVTYTEIDTQRLMLSIFIAQIVKRV